MSDKKVGTDGEAGIIIFASQDRTDPAACADWGVAGWDHTWYYQPGITTQLDVPVHIWRILLESTGLGKVDLNLSICLDRPETSSRQLLRSDWSLSWKSVSYWLMFMVDSSCDWSTRSYGSSDSELRAIGRGNSWGVGLGEEGSTGVVEIVTSGEEVRGLGYGVEDGTVTVDLLWRAPCPPLEEVSSPTEIQNWKEIHRLVSRKYQN